MMSCGSNWCHTRWKPVSVVAEITEISNSYLTQQFSTHHSLGNPYPIRRRLLSSKTLKCKHVLTHHSCSVGCLDVPQLQSG